MVNRIALSALLILVLFTSAACNINECGRGKVLHHGHCVPCARYSWWPHTCKNH